jgi:mRNA interferase MazF
MTTQKPKRGEIWLVNFDPTRGAEIKKSRPAVVVNEDEIGRLPLRVVVPITEWKETYIHYGWFTRLVPDSENGLSKDSGADAFQIRSVALERFIRKIGTLPDDVVDNIASSIALMVGYDLEMNS